MLKDLDITPEDPAELKAVNRLLANEVKALSLKVEQLQHQLHGANRHRFGSKSEGLDQLRLDLQEDAEIVQAAEAQANPPSPTKDAGKSKRQHSRKPLPDHLDREDEELSPGDDCGRCGGTLRTLGEDVTEELEYVPGRFKVKRIIRPRKACSCCEAIVQSPLPSRPIERGRPGPGLLAHVLVSKYADHLPLYRLSQIFAREGIDLDRSTMADWVGRSTALLEPLADAIGRIVRQGAALFADDTPVKMLAPGNKKTKTARVWTYVRDERPWSGQSPPCVWYQFTVDRKGEHPVSHLLGYKGWVHADGYSGFNGLFGDDKADEMACMAHVRRKFVDVFASQGSAIAEEAIRRIALLYAIEKEIRAWLPSTGPPCGRPGQSRSLTNLKSGCMRNCPGYQANLPWPRPSAMPWAGCRRRGHISATATWIWTTTQPSALSNRWPSGEKIGCFQAPRVVEKPWLSPSR